MPPRWIGARNAEFLNVAFRREEVCPPPIWLFLRKPPHQLGGVFNIHHRNELGVIYFDVGVPFR